MTLLDDLTNVRKDLDKIEDLVNKEVKSIDARLTNIEKSFGEWTAVAEAISRRGVTTRQFVLGILALLVPFVIVAITLIATSQ